MTPHQQHNRCTLAEFIAPFPVAQPPIADRRTIHATTRYARSTAQEFRGRGSMPGGGSGRDLSTAGWGLNPRVLEIIFQEKVVIDERESVTETESK
jgi:hypothetical protein